MTLSKERLRSDRSTCLCPSCHRSAESPIGEEPYYSPIEHCFHMYCTCVIAFYRKSENFLLATGSQPFVVEVIGV